MAVIEAKNAENVDMFKGLNFVAVLSLLGWGLGYFGQPHIWHVLWRRIHIVPFVPRAVSAWRG